MRVTQNYSLQSMLRQINQSRENINTLQRDLATGKRINQISDDPEKIESVLRFGKMLKLNDRFKSNLNNAMDFMNISSQALDDAVDIVAHLKELAVQGVDSLDDEEWNAFAEQADQDLRQLVDIANTRFKDRFVFGGSNTLQDPFTLQPDGGGVFANPAGTGGALKTEIGEHKIEQYNVSGQAAFGGTIDVFQTAVDLRDALTSHDTATVQGIIDLLDQAENQVLNENAKLGAKINRFEMFVQQYESQDEKLQGMLSKIQDTDAAEAITNLQLEQTGLQTALQVLSRTLNISLVNYMR